MSRLGRREFIRNAGLTAALSYSRILRADDSTFGRETAVWTESRPVLERPAKPLELLAYPEDGASAGVNPPGFCWTPHADARAYRLEIRTGSDASQKILPTQPVKSTVCPLSHVLDPGHYLWQVAYLDSSGKAYGVSKTRRFSIPAGAPQLPMPDVARLKEKLAKVRPRLFLTGSRLEEIREAVDRGSVAYWKSFIEATDAALKDTSYQEPPPPAGGVETDPEWRRIFTPAKSGSAHLARTALAYRTTGEPKYLEGARRWMMTLAGWNPRGITSHDIPQPGGTGGVDEASMPMLERMSLGWDWMGDRLAPEDRKKVLEVMKERGSQVLRLLHKQDFLSHPFSNHEGRVLAFLGLAGLSFLGDIPEADDWLEYVLRCYLTSYPSWGGDEGGWAQGMSYWSSYVYWLTNCVEALRRVTDTDLYRRPFYRHTGYFALYFQPPYAARGAFGDGGDHGPSELDRILIERFADVFDDPVLKWHALSIAHPEPTESSDPWRQWYIEDVFSILTATAKPSRIEPRPPTDLDGSRFLPNIGWVAAHSALGDPQNDVWVLFKASRFGSFSHSHGDQNTYQLNAYGHALAVDSGYYPWYDSPHDNLWTRQTRAHNGVLVNGRGQPPHTWAAQGRIEFFERHGLVTVVRGQAAQAYNLPQPEYVARQWLKELKEPIPPMEPKVKTFERTLAFFASRMRPMLFIHDFLRSSAPTTFDWLLHALNQMQADDGSGTITIQDGEARAQVQLLCSKPFRFSQRTGFPIPPEFPENTAYQDLTAKFPDQWHLSAHTESPAEEIKFLAIVIPYRASEPPPDISRFESDRTVGFRVGGSKVAAWWGAGETGQIEMDGLAGHGRMILALDEDGKRRTVVCR
jgi:hypothetical protein